MSDSPTLTIRSQRNDDLDNLFALWTLEGTLLNSVELPYISEDAFRDRFGSPLAHTLIAETGLPSGRRRIVGAAWLQVQRLRRRHAGRLDLLVHPDYHTTDAETALLAAILDLADNWLALRRVEVIAYADQDTAIALYERHGFAVEATMRRYAVRGGVYMDAVFLARLRTNPSQQRGQDETP